MRITNEQKTHTDRILAEEFRSFVALWQELFGLSGRAVCIVFARAQMENNGKFAWLKMVWREYEYGWLCWLCSCSDATDKHVWQSILGLTFCLWSLRVQTCQAIGMHECELAPENCLSFNVSVINWRPQRRVWVIFCKISISAVDRSIKIVWVASTILSPNAWLLYFPHKTESHFVHFECCRWGYIVVLGWLWWLPFKCLRNVCVCRLTWLSCHWTR